MKKSTLPEGAHHQLSTEFEDVVEFEAMLVKNDISCLDKDKDEKCCDTVPLNVIQSRRKIFSNVKS
jgi:hypothetical protein